MRAQRLVSRAQFVSSFIAWLRKPVCEVSGSGLALLVVVGFVILHLFLAEAIDLYIDHDELQYGQHAVLILDGFWDSIRWERPNGREGFVLLFGPLVTPFFAVLGASLMTLRIAYVFFAGFWAAAWVSLARCLAPQTPAWAVAGLFILPAPFISRYSVSSTAMSTHLGVSTAYAVAVLLLVNARRAHSARRWLWLFAAGLVAGFGAYGGLLMTVLLPGVLVGAATLAGLPGSVVVLLGMLPGLAFAFLTGNPFVAFSTVSEYVRPQVNLWAPFEALVYAPGYLPPRSWDGNYLPAGFGYFGFVAVVYILARRARAERLDPMLAALLISAACLLASFIPGHHTPWGKTRWQWDGLRYSAPLLPIAAVFVLANCSRLAKAGRRGAATLAALLLVAHAVGFMSHVSWHRLFDARISTAWIRPYLRFDPLVFPLRALPNSGRHDLYALRHGMEAFVADEADWPTLEARARTLGLEGRALQEYWRGVGRARVIWRMKDELWNRTLAWNLPIDVHEAVWQGSGMEAHLCDYEDRTEGLDRLLPTSAAERAAYAWGWTRVCTDDGHAPSLLPELALDRRLGRRLRWDLDLAVPEAPRVTDEDLEELIFKQWVP